jgi:hypothetical protein
MSKPSKTDIVIEAFLAEQAKKFSDTPISTDGHTLYSYTMPIARHAPDKTMLIIRYNNAPSSTTRKHVRGIEIATRGMRPDLFVSYVEAIDNDRRELFPNIGPGARSRGRSMRLTSGSERGKLIFPDHGGVLVPANTKVVKTANHREGKRVYTIKVVRYEPATRAMYVNGGRAYGYHILGPDGVTGSNSGNSVTVSECVEKAISTIKGDLAQQRRELTESRKTPAQKSHDRLKKNAEFFRKNAGCDMKGAMDLAQAEFEAEALGWTVEWNFDPGPYELGDAETEVPKEVLVATLKNAKGETLASLGGIGDPTPKYGRVIEAELALEALSR